MTGNWIRRPEGGGRLSLRLLCGFALSFGRAPARGILYFIAFYFMLRRGAERRASRAFLGRALGRPATHLEVYRHILRFSQVTLDRIFLLQEGMQQFEIECVGLDDIHGMMALNRGVLLFGAHFGSFEIMRVLSLRRPDLKFRAVIDLEQAPAMSQLLNALNPELAATVINAREAGPAVVLAIKDALEQRAAVTLLADRVRPGGRVIKAEFMGTHAPFPAAPWEIAALLGVPVVVCFGAYLGGNRYHLQFEALTELVVRERAGGPPLSRWVQAYADRLAARARATPYNWFNFYDFWSD
jgi:predicted LPLAT superfamily acyltransferase